MTPEKTGKTETLVIEGSPGRLTVEQLKDARAAMGRLKFHPRESLPNATLIARADALFVELVGNDRDELRDAIATFRASLESQDQAEIEAYRDRLTRLVNQLRR
jgi:molecular chaperone HscC